MKKIKVLGTEYTIEEHKISEDECMKENNFAGYCCEERKLIVILDVTEKEYVDLHDKESQERYRKKILRHEIIHAFLNESGLSVSSSVPKEGWARNEEMVDWIAIQSPKIFKIFTELELL